MLKSSCLLGSLILVGVSAMTCRRAASESKPQLSQQTLRTSSLRFIQQTNLLGSSGGSAGGSSGGFQPSTFPPAGFWPATPLVLPARAAAFINQTYGASGGFQYQTFEFSSTGCSANNAFGRYFDAIETLRGTPVTESEKAQMQDMFSNIFTGDNVEGVTPSICVFYDLMACIADYAVLNQSVFSQAAQSGDFASVFKGAFSCVAEVLGVDPTDPTDPTDTTDPDDSGDPFPDE
ncbi:MAG TPA: hypothetical protein VE954_30090 [Oligoflexus sp.]|uniref:hypothetical protein n=1 Tax=Oligoflexus sp. TaxID=1971216 RepID=UPI002D56E86D|nr:hypothetical protein [Oligoflexus sp.]HYX37375.1 hypothetical protein [Oligoflexus sp.]